MNTPSYLSAGVIAILILCTCSKLCSASGLPQESLQVTPATVLDGRVTTPSVPTSTSTTNCTSTTPNEDSRKSLYEILKDPVFDTAGYLASLSKTPHLFKTAGIEDVLTRPGPFTVIFPAHRYAYLPLKVREHLRENPVLLRQLFLYHVAIGEILPSNKSESYTVPTLEGSQLLITILRGGKLILINGEKVVADTRASNGILYVIKEYLYPIPYQDIDGAIQSYRDLSILAYLLPLSGLRSLLQGETLYTFLAPTDLAFARLSSAACDELLRNSTALQEVLLNHLFEGVHYGREFYNTPTYTSERGGKLKIQVVKKKYLVNGVNIKTPKIVTGTGVIHLIDELLLDDSDRKFLNNSLNVVGEGTPAGEQNPNCPFQPAVGQNPNSPNQPAVGQNLNNQFQPAIGQPQTGQRRGTNQRLPPDQSQLIGLQPPVRGASPRFPSGQVSTGGQQQPGQGQTSSGYHTPTSRGL